MPLDASGFTASIIGLILVVVITVGFILAHGPREWIYILVTATVIGLILVPFTAIHRYRHHHHKPTSDSPGVPRVAVGNQSVED